MAVPSLLAPGAGFMEEFFHRPFLSLRVGGGHSFGMIQAHSIYCELLFLIWCCRWPDMRYLCTNPEVGDPGLRGSRGGKCDQSGLWPAVTSLWTEPLTPSHILAFSQHTGQVSQGAEGPQRRPVRLSGATHGSAQRGTAIPVASSLKVLVMCQASA